jgi:hypothetical protein
MTFRPTLGDEPRRQSIAKILADNEILIPTTENQEALFENMEGRESKV